MRLLFVLIEFEFGHNTRADEYQSQGENQNFLVFLGIIFHYG